MIELLSHYIILSIVELFVTHRIMTCLFGCPRKNGIFPYVVYSGYLFLSVTQILNIYLFHFTIFTSIILTFCVCMGYESDFNTRLLATIIKVSIGVACEGSVDLFLMLAFNINQSGIKPGESYYTISVLLTAICKIAIILLLEKVTAYFKNHTRFLYSCILGMLSVLIVCILYMVRTFADSPYFPAAFIIVILLLVSIALCVGLLYDNVKIQNERLRLNFLERQNQEQVAHYTALYDRNNKTHQIRHDLHNFLIGAQTLIKQGDIERLEEYIEKQQETVRPQKLTDTGNPLLDAVLSAKQQESPEIAFQIRLPQLHCDYIDPMDTAMVLAAALDNAVEGCAGCPEQYISIHVLEKGSSLFLEIKNPTHTQPKERLGKLVSTKSEPEKHGYGILSMRRIAEHYNGNLTWDVENDVFTLRVLMQDIQPASS